MKTLTTFFAVLALSFCLTHSAQGITLGGSLNGSGWLPQGGSPGLAWTKADHAQAQQDAIQNANELLDLHVALQMWDFPNQVYEDHIILEDDMSYFGDDPAHYTYSIYSYLIFFESGQFAVIYP